MEGVQVVTQDFVNVLITKSDSEDAPPIERRFKKGITIQEFKMKLEMVTGGTAGTMKLKVFDNKNNLICDIDNDDALLGSYPIDDGMRIHVTDNFTLVKDFDSADAAERFRLSEEEYEKKDDTLRAFLQRNKLGKYNEEEMNKLKEQQQKELEEEAKLAASVVVGSRCAVRVGNTGTRRATVRYNGPLEGARGLWIGVQYDEPRGKNDGTLAASVVVGSRCAVRVGNTGTRRATVRYNGPLEGARGLWIGVQYDEPRGKNDGTFNGKRYFTCPPKYGGFVKPVYVTLGDFPVEEDDLDDEI